MGQMTVIPLVALLVCWGIGGYMKVAAPLAAVAIALGVALLESIRRAGHRALAHPEGLEPLFRAGLRWVALTMLTLMAIYFAVAVATFIVIPGGEILILGAFLACGAGVRNIVGAIDPLGRRGSIWSRGLPLTREEHPDLWALVDQVAHRLGSTPPDHILGGFAPDFFVTEARVEHPTGFLCGKTMYVSVPMCRILERQELKAIIAHELGHLRGADTALDLRLFAVLDGVDKVTGEDAWNRDPITSFFFPVEHLLTHFLRTLLEAKCALNRSREFVADQAAADVAGIRATASSLLKSVTYSRPWVQTLHALCRGLEPAAAGEHFLSVSQSAITADLVYKHYFEVDSDPLATHPALCQRLESLGVKLASVMEPVLRIPPADPAFHLFTAPERLESETAWTFLWGSPPGRLPADMS